MRHVSLACRNHPDLRWSCKEIAVAGQNPGDPAGYNSQRSLFYLGRTTGALHADGSGVRTEPCFECDCSADDLIIAPEDAEIKRRWRP